MATISAITALGAGRWPRQSRQHRKVKNEELTSCCPWVDWCTCENLKSPGKLGLSVKMSEELSGELSEEPLLPRSTQTQELAIVGTSEDTTKAQGGTCDYPPGGQPCPCSQSCKALRPAPRDDKP